MTREELTTRLEAAEKQMLGLQDEITNLKAKLDEAREDEIPDMPVFHNNETYWRMYPTLKHIKSYVIQSDYVGECFNLFHTKEYADEFADKCKIIAMLLHCKWYLDRDYVPDWSDKHKHKWQLYYDHDAKKMGVANYSHSDYGVVFSTRESAQKAADWMNEHAIGESYE